MPVEDGLRGDEEPMPPLTRDEASQQGDQRPVRPREAGPRALAAEDRQLVAQDQDLGILRQVVQMVYTDELKDATEETVEERQGHELAAWPNASELVKRNMGVIGPFRQNTALTAEIHQLTKVIHETICAGKGA